MVKKVFIVTGMAPTQSKEVNQFLKACDLGMEGAFVPKSLRITATMDNKVTPSHLKRQIPAFKAAFEELGWTNITVKSAK